MPDFPKIPPRSPSGQPTCPSAGPADAEILLVGENPASNEIKNQLPFVGQAGRLLSQSCSTVNLDRSRLRIVNVVPCLAPGNEFANLADVDLQWGLRLLAQEIAALPQLKIIVALGNNPMAHLMGLHGITKWRGSLFPPLDQLVGDHYNEYWTLLGTTPTLAQRRDVAYLATFHPAAVARQMPWHIWLNHDLRQAKDYAESRYQPPRRREWHVNDLEGLPRFVDDVVIGHERAVGIDTEMSPSITALVSEEEVHVFTWTSDNDHLIRPSMTRLLTSKEVVKIAHNMAHDWRDFEKVHGVRVERPWYDTLGGAHILEPSGFDPGGDRDKKAKSGQIVGKALSPHISTKYTSWPYHKWLVDLDPHHYCGIDSVVGYDAYWQQIREFSKKPQLAKLVVRDMRYFEILFDMQRRGVLVDQRARLEEAQRLRAEVDKLDAKLQAMVTSVIAEALSKGRLRKPHLFQETRSCECCRAAKNKRQACWSCAGFLAAPSKKQLDLYMRQQRDFHERPDGWLKWTKAQLEAYLLGPCRACQDTPDGKITRQLDFNWDSSDQLADLFYRALGVPARRHKGTESTKVELLERLLDDGALLAQPTSERHKTAKAILEVYVERQRLAIDLDTVERLTPDEEGRIRSVFDPWYTPTARVAAREGLHDLGTNLQNIPKLSRRFIVADPGYLFFYPDLRQVEGRALAVLSGDKALMAIYSSGGDSHQMVADMIREKSGVNVTRDQAKRTFFMASYGGEADHLSQILGTTHLEALTIINALFVTFPGLKRWQDKTRAELRASRSNTTPTGWTRRWLGYVLEERGRRRGQVKDKVWKEALASTPQYIGAWVLAEGLMRLNDEHPWILPAAHVHDAGLLLVPRDRAQEAILAMESAMNVHAFDMDFPVDASPGPNWYIASLSDKEKKANNYAEWTRDAVLANGCPDGQTPG